MDRFRSTLGALADWVGRRVVWLRATLGEGRPRLQGGERGQGLTEYALIISLIALAVIAASLVTWLKTKALDVGMAGNGAIAGLVAITAPSGYVEF